MAGVILAVIHCQPLMDVATPGQDYPPLVLLKRLNVLSLV